MIESCLEKEVVLDVSGSFLYLGVLKSIHPDWLVLSPVDVHDREDGKSSKETYIRECQKNGIRFNRQSCYIARDKILSVSLLNDVMQFS